MKTTLLVLLASVGLACAELSPEEFNKVRNFALTCGREFGGNGFHFVGVLEDPVALWVYRFRNVDLVCDVPTWVDDFEEAREYMILTFRRSD
jgi:hypothetical protein